MVCGILFGNLEVGWAVLARVYMTCHFHTPDVSRPWAFGRGAVTGSFRLVRVSGGAMPFYCSSLGRGMDRVVFMDLV